MQKSYKLDLTGIDTEAYQKSPVVQMLFDNQRQPIGKATIAADRKSVLVEFADSKLGKDVIGGNFTLGTSTATFAGGVKRLMGLSIIPVQLAKPRSGAAKPRVAKKNKRANGTKKTTKLPSYGLKGAPTKLTAAMLKGTLEYYQQKKTDKEMPFVEELAIDVLDVDRHTVARWHDRGEDKEWLAKQPTEKAELFAQFCATIKKLATMQLLQLKVRGIKTGHNTVAIFLMKADHNMIETSRTELGGINGAPIEYRPVEVLSTKGRQPSKAAK